MSVSTLEVRAPFWCLVLRPLHTLWSLVCAKGVVRGRPRKEVQTSAKPFGNIREENKGRQNPARRGSALIGKGLQTNHRSKLQVDSASRKMGRGCPCTFIKILPSKEVVVEKDQGEHLKSLTDTGWVRVGYKRESLTLSHGSPSPGGQQLSMPAQAACVNVSPLRMSALSSMEGDLRIHRAFRVVCMTPQLRSLLSKQSISRALLKKPQDRL